MPPEYQFAASLLTIILSGVASAAVTYRLNKRREEKVIRQQKLEKLYLAFDRFCENLGCQFLLYVDGFSAKLDYNQINEQIIAQGEDRDKPHVNANMLLAIYFPEMQPFMMRLIECRETGGDIISDYKAGYKRGSFDGKALYDRMGPVIDTLEEIKKDFDKAVRQEGQRIARI